MDEIEKKFFTASFDRLELLLERIAIAIEKKKPERRLQESIPVQAALKIADAWNEWKQPAFPRINGLSPQSTRYKNALARWLEKPNEEYWIGVIQRVNESKFCCGDNERGWVADFEFLVRPDNHHRILEGKYDKCHLSHKKEIVHSAKQAVDVTHLLLEKLPT